MNKENIFFLKILSLVLLVLAIILAFSFPSNPPVSPKPPQARQLIWESPVGTRVIQSTPSSPKPAVPPEMHLHEGEEEEGC